MKDREIVNLYWQRDERAIAETSARYGAYCSSIARNILHQAEDVEECVNDTWMNAWNSMPPHRPEVLPSFLGKITRYICLKKWRERYAQKRGGDNHGYVYLKNADGEVIYAGPSILFWDETHSGSYDEEVFDIPAEGSSGYQVYGAFWTGAKLTKGSWQVTFPLEDK